MRIRNFKQSDYVEIASWWMVAGMDVPRLDLIPEQTSFLIESEKEEPIALVSLWVFDKVVWVESVVGNPQSDKVIRKEAVEALQKKVEEFSKAIGAKILFGYVEGHKESLKKRYQALGYTIGKEVVLIHKEL